jgi:hypothetical protein
MQKLVDKPMIAYTQVRCRGGTGCGCVANACDGKKHWIRIGRAVEKDGQIVVQLDAMPLSGVVFLRPLDPDREAR